MAYKTAIEKLVLNNIDLVVSTDNKLFVNDVKQADSIDVASIDTRVGGEENKRSTDVDSIDTRLGSEEDKRSTDVDSIDTRVGSEEDKRSTDVASIDSRLGNEEVSTQVASIALTEGDESIEISFSSDLGMSAFDSTPVVAGMLRNSGDNANIIIAMLAGDVTTAGCKFVFSEGLTDGNYSLDIIVTD